VTLQPQYNLLVREIEWEIVPACRSTGLGLLPWSPLGGGWLTGKYTRKARPTGATRLGENPDRGVEAYDRRSTQQRTWDVIDAVDSIAGARGVTMAQVALAWLLGRPMVSSVILGARTLAQLNDNLAAIDVHHAARVVSGEPLLDPVLASIQICGVGHDAAGRTPGSCCGVDVAGDGREVVDGSTQVDVVIPRPQAHVPYTIRWSW